MRHVLVAALLFGLGMIFTSFAASSLQGWAMSRVTNHDTEPVPEVAEFLLPTTPGGRKRTSGPNCEAPAAGPMTFIKTDGGGRK
jgi:hypothetical protein